MNLEIRHLKLVKAIVEEGSIAKAIERLHLTPSALSHQLREAELQIGAKLFNRVNKKLILTDIGEKVLNTATLVLNELDAVENEIKKITNEENGTIRISTECYTAYHWLPGVLKKFSVSFPSIRIEIVPDATYKSIEKLLKGEIDIALTSDPVANKNIAYIELFKDEMVALVTDTHSWNEREYVVAEDFKDQQLIIYSKPLETVTIYQKLLIPADVEPKKLIELPLTEAAVEMVKADMGIMVMASWALKPYLSNKQLRTVRLTSTGLHRTHFAAVLESKDRPSYYNLFLKFLKEELLV